MTPDSRYSLFAVTAPGLEPMAEQELRRMGVAGVAEPGGVAWEGPPRELYAANLRLRTASRVLVRVAAFRARTFYELERHADRIPWGRFLPPDLPANLRVSSAKSKLYHEGAIAERLAAAIERSTGRLAAASAAADEEDDDAAAQLFVVRFLHDRCTVSVDSSGALLHRRGYRQQIGKAPLRETLAAAMLEGCGWRPEAPLIDPFCGSGTIPIEAALIARRIPPGLSAADRSPRAYAFQRWPDFQETVWQQVVEEGRAQIRPRAGAPILASDRDAGATEATARNAERAGVAADLEIQTLPLSAIRPPPGTGWLVSNPPYGVRVGERSALRNLYAALGRVARESLPGWTIALLGADPALPARTGIDLHEALRTRNGGIPVRLLVGRIG